MPSHDARPGPTGVVADWYERHVLPYLLGWACGTKPVRRLRESVVPLAAGRVLEVGIGTGLNLGYYDRSRVTQVVGLEPGLHLHRRAAARGRRAGIEIELFGEPAERMTAADASFDSVVITYTLCTVSDPIAALGEMRRVLRPQGRLIFCEHGRAPDPRVARRQDRLTPLWRRCTGGCHLNRDVLSLLHAAGFECSEARSLYLPGPRPMTWTTWGVATPV